MTNKKYDTMKQIRNIFFLLTAVIFFNMALIMLRKAYLHNSCDGELLNWYYVGGIISGVFAFGAFIVAVFSNRSQQKNIDLQRFESTFFNMLSQHQQITSELSFSYTYKENIKEDAPDPTMGRLIKEVVVTKEIKGRELFRFLFTTRVTKELGIGICDSLKDGGIESYTESQSPPYFDHYFRHLYRTIKYIHETDFLTYNQKYKYTSIVRATLSRYELIWLYYNCLSPYGQYKFKHLIEEYSLLKNMREELLVLSKETQNILHEKGITKDMLENEGFSCTDYEYRLTEKKGENENFFISAFYSKNEFHIGKSVVEKWNNFVNKCLMQKVTVKTTVNNKANNDDDEYDESCCDFI